jgi:hypothetical protein
MTQAVATKPLHSHGRCGGCGRALRPSGSELLGAVSASIGDAIGRVVSGVGQVARASTKRRSRCDGCDECDPCVDADCRCQCCVGDADLLVYARLGERRVVPISVENTRRREREVQVSLSTFTTASGKSSGVRGQLLPPTDFTVAPCQEREVTLLLAATGATGDQDKEDVVEDLRESMEAAVADAEERRERLPDVEECEVAYADLRVVGCDVRPVRIAVAVLPRDCASYSVACGCGCC